MNSSINLYSDDTNETSSLLFFSNFTFSFCFSSWAFQNFVTAVKWIEVSQMILGTFLNSGLLLTILTSKDLLSLMRNRILSCMCLQNLFESLIYLPFSIYFWSQYIQHLPLSCSETLAFHSVFFSNEFVSNWNIILILALAVYTEMNVNFISQLSSLVVKIASYVILLIPWLLSAFIVLPVLFSSYQPLGDITPDDNGTLCFIPKSSFKIFYFTNIGVPAVLMVTLLAALIIFKRIIQVQRPATKDMSRQLISQPPGQDRLLPYLLFVGAFFLCDFGLMLNLINLNHCMAKYLHCTLNLLEGFRVYLLPLSFLFFPEIRSRAVEMILKVIRPRRGSDITMTYVKET